MSSGPDHPSMRILNKYEPLVGYLLWIVGRRSYIRLTYYDIASQQHTALGEALTMGKGAPLPTFPRTEPTHPASLAGIDG